MYLRWYGACTVRRAVIDVGKNPRELLGREARERESSVQNRHNGARARTSIGLDVRVAGDVFTVFDGPRLVGRGRRVLDEDDVEWTVVPHGIADEALREVEDVALALPADLGARRIYLVA